jgi:glycosyltransferase involved in cell wall biosynthesis
MTLDNSAAAQTAITEQKKRLRIAVLTRNFSPAAGGAERYSIAMVEQLAARHDITVFAQFAAHDWPNVKYHLISSPFKRPRWVNQLWFAAATWWATRRGFDVVHSHENTWHGNVQTVHVLPVRYNVFKSKADSSKLKKILTWFGVLISPRLLCYLVLEHFRYAPKPGHSIIVTSHTLLERFVDCFPKAANFTSVITPGIDMPASVTSPQNRLEARQQLGLPPGVPCLLFVGNDFKKKGLQTAIEALSFLPASTVLAVAGASRQIDFFRQRVVAAGLDRRVFFLGALNNTQQAYLAATCLVHPTREDTFGMVVLEAMSFGLPVVVSSAPYCGVTDMLEHGVNALVLDTPFDPQELALKIAAVLDNELLRTTLGNEARSFAGSFPWYRLAQQQESIYCDAAGV